MSFQQVFYTSCEEGLSNTKGFQVKAASPEIPPAVLQMVEKLGLYIPPLSLPSRPTPEEMEKFPISLIFQTLNDEIGILGQAKYIGLDYSGRSGNFFTHSLVSPKPYADFFESNRIMPIQMWKSGFWVTLENDSTVLPDVEKISPGSKTEFESVQAFLQDPARREMLPRFLTAVVEALETKRRIIIVDENENIALWIAAASYALPFHLILKLTFNIYAQNPYQTEAIITGTTEDSDFNFAPHEIEHQYFVFDIKGNRYTKIEPGNFAVKAAFIYRQPYSGEILGFAGFIEEVAPKLAIEELNDALATFGYFADLDLPDVDDIKVLQWCSRYLPQLADRNFDNLFRKVTEKSPVDEEILRAATDFYLATLNSDINAQDIRHIENLYLEWLLSTVCRTADTSALAETTKRLPHPAYLDENNENHLNEWLKNLRDVDDPLRFAVMLQIGNVLNFLKQENDILRWMGKNIVGKWLTDDAIQASICNNSDQAGGKILLEGIAEFLSGQTGSTSLFTAILPVLSDEKTYRILLNYVVGNGNLPLYLRIVGTRANSASEKFDRADILFQLLSNIERTFQIEITSEVVQSAFNAIWLDRTPTTEEAVQLISSPLKEYIVKSDIPPQLVDLINPKDKPFSPSQKELIIKLSSKNFYVFLGDKAATAQVYRLIVIMQQGDFVDQDGEKLIEYLTWAAENKKFIASVAPRLYEIIGQKFVKIKNSLNHGKKLPIYSKEPTGSFLTAYSLEAERLLQSKERSLEIARLLKTWMIAEQHDKTFGEHLLKWSTFLLQNQSRKEIGNIEKAMDKQTYEIWVAIKEFIKDQDKGMFGRLLGSIFQR